MSVDFLVGCVWDGTANELGLLAGNAEGDGVVCKVEAGCLTVKRVLSGGHRACVRAFVPCLSSGWLGGAGGASSCVFLTGGEDARLCEWNVNGGNGNSLNSSLGVRSSSLSKDRVSYTLSSKADPKMGGGPIKRSKKKQGHAPY